MVRVEPPLTSRYSRELMTAPLFPHRHLLGIDGLSRQDIESILDEAEPWIAFNRGARKEDRRLSGLTQINAFFENSTRTLFSFEIAGKRLGAQVSNFHPAGSSVRKGESLIDTALTLNAMRPDLLVIRHEANGAAADVAAVMANSNLRSLPMLGASLRLVAPPLLMPETLPAGVEGHDDLERGIDGADVVMMLRIQRERMEEAVSGSLGDFHARYGLSRERLDRAAPNALVMHPGPMNRGIEIDSDVADDPDRSAILEQVELGVAVRMACLDLLTRSRREA